MARMANPERVDAIRDIAAATAAEDPRILALYLFGSRADGTEHERSDVDLAVLFREPVDLGEVISLETRFEDRLGLPVDLIDFGKASPFLALRVVRGERLYCTEKTRCNEFELYVLRRAADLAPFERERRRMLLTPGHRVAADPAKGVHASAR